MPLHENIVSHQKCVRIEVTCVKVGGQSSHIWVEAGYTETVCGRTEHIGKTAGFDAVCGGFVGGNPGSKVELHQVVMFRLVVWGFFLRERHSQRRVDELKVKINTSVKVGGKVIFDESR